MASQAGGYASLARRGDVPKEMVRLSVGKFFFTAHTALYYSTASGYAITFD